MTSMKTGEGKKTLGGATHLHPHQALSSSKVAAAEITLLEVSLCYC